MQILGRQRIGSSSWPLSQLGWLVKLPNVAVGLPFLESRLLTDDGDDLNARQYINSFLIPETLQKGLKDGTSN